MHILFANPRPPPQMRICILSKMKCTFTKSEKHHPTQSVAVKNRSCCNFCFHKNSRTKSSNYANDVVSSCGEPSFFVVDIVVVDVVIAIGGGGIATVPMFRSCTSGWLCLQQTSFSLHLLLCSPPNKHSSLPQFHTLIFIWTLLAELKPEIIQFVNCSSGGCYSRLLLFRFDSI